MIFARSVADARYSQTCPTGSLRSPRCEENLRTRQGVGAKSLLMAVYMSCSKNQLVRSRFKGADRSEMLCARVDPAHDWHHFLLYGVQLKVNPQLTQSHEELFSSEELFQPQEVQASILFPGLLVFLLAEAGYSDGPLTAGPSFRMDLFSFINRQSVKFPLTNSLQKKKRKKKKYLDSWHHWGFFHSFL